MKTSMKVFKTVTESKEQDPSPDILTNVTGRFASLQRLTCKH